jgi:hypothetical protein
VEKDHTLILGWSEKIITILEEICAACETMADGSEGGCIVILNDTMEKQEMDAILYDRIGPGREIQRTLFITIFNPRSQPI